MFDDPADAPTANLTWWDRLVVALHGWWWSKRHRYCTACDVIHRPRDPAHRSCHCGISRPDTWTDADRAAFRAIIDAARRKHGGESRDLGSDR